MAHNKGLGLQQASEIFEALTGLFNDQRSVGNMVDPRSYF